ncbi:MAG: NAD-dependent epimerase/dehydratase family protein [Planctomycetaceae bacterium]
MPQPSPPPAVLITGGAGFLGSHVVRGMLNDERYAGLKLLVLDDLSGGFLQNIPDSPCIEFVQGSILDDAAVDRIFREHTIRFVFHLAAYAAEGLSHFIRRFNYSNNLIGSVNLINASVRHQVERFVFTSSIAVYGSAQVPMTEATVPEPEDPYGISKLAVEMDLKAAERMFGLPFTIFRPHNVYGEFQNIGDRYRNVVGIFMNRILQNLSLPVFGDGSQQRAFSYVGDLIPAIIGSPFVAASRNAVFNVGASTPVSVKDLAEIVSREFGVTPNLEFLPPRNEVQIAWSDHSRCDEVFGAVPETSLADGIRRMATWVRSVGARRSQSFDNIEITDGLPPSWQPAELPEKHRPQATSPSGEVAAE